MWKRLVTHSSPWDAHSKLNIWAPVFRRRVCLSLTRLNCDAVKRRGLHNPNQTAVQIQLYCCPHRGNISKLLLLGLYTLLCQGTIPTMWTDEIWHKNWVPVVTCGLILSTHGWLNASLCGKSVPSQCWQRFKIILFEIVILNQFDDLFILILNHISKWWFTVHYLWWRMPPFMRQCWGLPHRLAQCMRPQGWGS